MAVRNNSNNGGGGGRIRGSSSSWLDKILNSSGQELRDYRDTYFGLNGGSRRR